MSTTTTQHESGIPPLFEEQEILRTQGLSKSFGSVIANKDIDITLYQGEIISILGENGAGKSTLMNMLYGLYKPSAGQIYVKGKSVSFTSPRDAIAQGIGMVHQHFMLIEPLSVLENIILGNEPYSWKGIDHTKARKEVSELIERFNLHIDLDAKVEDIPVGLQQRVEIVKALYRKVDVLILDEPTAVLTPQEIQDFFHVIRTLRDRGVSVIIITHKLEEIKQISRRVYILRKGKIVGEQQTEGLNREELANLMVGRNVVLNVEKPEPKVENRELLSTKNLQVLGNRGTLALHDLSLSVRPGEIVAIAGVDGNGQEELAEAIMGLRKVQKGVISFEGESITKTPTKDRIAQGISYVPADRHKSGLVLDFTLGENILLGNHRTPPLVSRGFLQEKEIYQYSDTLIDQYGVMTPSSQELASHLSGGNQQKVVLAREFERDPKFIIVAQPTRGLDVGAIEYIHSQIIRMRDQGVGILLISLELEEVFSLADRILVLFEGRIVKELNPKETNEQEVGLYMTGSNSHKEDNTTKAVNHE